MIPFSPPRIDDKICDEVVATLKSGWITTGPRTKLFEKKITEYCGNKNTICLNSATAGLELMLRWFGVGPGDEVILPAYTYSATANVIIHCGATPVFVDVNASDFNISAGEVEKAITAKTKVIMPVDFGGMPCDYIQLNAIAEKSRTGFVPASVNQKILGRILVLSDSAHSFGAEYNGAKAGALTDISVFSFHAVKNLTTAEGGAVALNLPAPFNNEEIYKALCVTTLHGQNKDALAKTQRGNWKYDIVEAGYKCNMTDITAAIGLVELDRYDNDTLLKRKHIVDTYNQLLGRDKRFELPVFETKEKKSCFHLYPLRIRNITEPQRDAMMQEIFNADVSVNVHFIPVPGMSFYRNLGYNLADYKVTCDNFSREISLPVFYDLTDDQIMTVVKAVTAALDKTTC
ncbi:MAG: DegT/DnrJ/EryC1/StrS family aminotransferase [Bacteroidota bacterium]